MASASLLYYCHNCDRRISPVTEDILCPDCHGGFVEPVEGENNDAREQSNQDQAARAEDEFPYPLNMFRLFGGSESNNQVSNIFLNTSNVGGENDSRQSIVEPASSSGGPYDLRPRNRAAQSTTNNSQSRNDQLFIQDVMQHVVGGFDHALFQFSLGGGTMAPWNFMQLHGNTGDYAWGPNGLDNIISQLLGQLESAGPPPASKQAIENLPTIEITETDVDVERDCSVCMEPFKLAEKAKKLPCKHFFHISCIEPWLELHNTCPICRKLVEESCGTQSSSNVNSASSSNSANASNPTNAEASFFSLFSNLTNTTFHESDDAQS